MATLALEAHQYGGAATSLDNVASVSAWNREVWEVATILAAEVLAGFEVFDLVLAMISMDIK